MKSNWKKVKLGTVVEDLTNSRLVDVINEGKIIEPTISSKTHTIGTRKELLGADVKVKKRVKLLSGDLVFARLHTQNGLFAFCDKEYTATQTFVPVKIKEEVIDRDYLFYALKTFIKNLVLSGDSVGRESYKTEQILSLEIPLPPLPEQKRIVKKIKEIEKKAKEIKTIKEKEFNYSEALLEEIFLNLISNDWPRIELGNPEIAKTGSGGTPDRGNPKYYKDGKIIWLKSGELKNNINISDSEEKITEEAINNSSAKLFPSGSVLIAMYGATVGKVGILSVPASMNQAVAAIIPIESKLYNKYLFYFLKSLRKDLLKSGFGGAQPNISQTVVKDILVPVPSLDEQKNLVKHFEDIKEKILKLDNEIKKSFDYANALMPSFLSKAFNGEL